MDKFSIAIIAKKKKGIEVSKKEVKATQIDTVVQNIETLISREVENYFNCDQIQVIITKL